MKGSVAFSLFTMFETTASVQLQNTSITPKIPYTFNSFSPCPPPFQAPITTNLHSVSMNLLILDISYIKQNHMWPFLSGFFHLTCFGGSCTLQCHYLLRLNNISLYVCSTICVSMHFPLFSKCTLPMISGTLH